MLIQGKSNMRVRTMMVAMASMAVLAAVPVRPVAAADQPTVQSRVDRLEREMRAVQRKVFPGGNSEYFAPEIAPPDQNQPLAGSPASSPVADLEGRVNAIEGQLATLTGQVETSQHRLQLLEESFAAYKLATDARLKALDNGTVGNGQPPAAAITSGPAEGALTTPSVATRPATTPSSPAVDTARAKAVSAIEAPVTTDPADDLYVYGFRLWNAKFYPEAETQLKSVVAKYPAHRRASWAQNLLGRSYLDEGKYKEAAQAFYDNYKKYPDGERTADSVYYLATALKKLNRPTQDVCKAYGVLTNMYGAKITAAMTADVAKQRADLKCS